MEFRETAQLVSSNLTGRLLKPRPYTSSMNTAASTRVIPLRTEMLQCFFKTDTGFIRRIRVGEVEVIRAIYGAVEMPRLRK